MKRTRPLFALLSTVCIAFAVRENKFLQKMPVLEQSAFTKIENNLSRALSREAATRAPGQFSVIILSGKNNALKQNTAQYLAQKVNANIYKVDLSRVISTSTKGTEENFHIVFEAAKNKNCILYFDEAEALFGRRTVVKNAYDKYAKEETNYFVKLVERYRYPVIISITAPNNINPLIFEKYIWFQV